jgi:hypothetical protein
MYTRIYVDDHRIRTMALFLRDFNIWHIGGPFTLTVPSLKLKVVLASVCKPWMVDGQEILATPGEAARAELKAEFPDLKRVGWFKGHARLFDYRVPFYFTGPVERRELYYVDISGAYLQCYQPLWLDVRYPCGRGYHSLYDVGARLADWKMARNSVVGIIRSRTATGIRGGKRVALATHNCFLAPELWASICDILQSFASVARRCGGLVYVNTDGYIFESLVGFTSFRSFLSGNGIAHKTQLGDGQVWGWGNYEVGGKRAGRASAPLAVKPFGNLSVHYSGILDWWLKMKERCESDRGQGK